MVQRNPMGCEKIGGRRKLRGFWKAQSLWEKVQHCPSRIGTADGRKGGEELLSADLSYHRETATEILGQQGDIQGDGRADQLGFSTYPGDASGKYHWAIQPHGKEGGNPSDPFSTASGKIEQGQVQAEIRRILLCAATSFKVEAYPHGEISRADLEPNGSIDQILSGASAL